MEEITITAQPRTVVGKQVRQLRRDGLVPAVIYGRRTEPIAVQIEDRILRQVLQRVGGNQLIRLQVGEDGARHTVLLREVQRDPIKRQALHVDFYEVLMTERVRTEIPVLLVGESPAIERGDGMLYRGIESVEVECLPGDLIPHIEVDISTLAEVDEGITVGDLQLGDHFQILSEPEAVLARIISVREEVPEEEAEAAPEAQAEVEVVSRERPAEGEEEA
jgi:large subunit ribosomal protein L25